MASTKPRVPRGDALPRPDEVLLGLRNSNESDVEDARTWNRRHAPVDYLDVRTEE